MHDSHTAVSYTHLDVYKRQPLSRQAMVELCNELEGHPDNVAPAVLGGMCASLVRDGRPVTARVDVSSEVGFIALIPNYASETRAMRARCV